MGEEAAPAITALIAALAANQTTDDPRSPGSGAFDPELDSSQTRPSGFQAALAAIGPACVPALLRQIDSSDLLVRTQAVRTLGLSGQGGKAAVPRLIGLLGHTDIRAEAVRALGNIGQPARAAFPMLVALLKNRDAELRARAAEALGRIAGNMFNQWTPSARKYVMEAMTVALKDKDRRVRCAAAGAFCELVPLQTPPHRS